MADDSTDKSVSPAHQPADALPDAASGDDLQGKLVEQFAEFEARMLQACQPALPVSPAFNKIGARKCATFKAICTAPSINRTPRGSKQVPLPYQTVQDLSNSVTTARTVNFNGLPAYLLDQTTQPKGTGDERGTGKGIRSRTVTGEVKPVSGCRTVRIEGKHVVREGDKCMMNGGNNPGVYVTTGYSSAISQPPQLQGYQCQLNDQLKPDAKSIALEDMRQAHLYRILGKAFPKATEAQQFFVPETPGTTDKGSLRTANNIVIALLGPFAVPGVLARSRGASEDEVERANNVGTGLFSLLGAGILKGQQPRTRQEVLSHPTTSLGTSPPRPSHNGLRVAATRKELKYKPTSGVRLVSDPEKTTTILGSYSKDMRSVIAETGNVKSVDFGARRGDFNILNVSDEPYIPPGQFWREYNKPWLEQAIKRNDRFLMATKPGFEISSGSEPRSTSVLTKIDPRSGKTNLSILGREYLILRRNGYHYENGEMKK